ncbi:MULTISPECIES: lipid-A-disaccharide synthase [unclassified Rhizobium]|uniref:lipid-A-disaccharide synthase n=1 Tax=unclassified Rhizobium TaxID=2613769 RepID=UPI0006FD90FC|nr:MULTISPECIES: lipid-A-disaccharide synthase [unclassified Rhizobium]KQV33068.1 lipid-A-disaccharide synthase [Rhizobium sp. Root1212]KRD21528.1 lipid-A-disaccharide synthase [Rhizobium sp. Root268]
MTGLKLAVIAGEVSGDLLGADLVRALKPMVDGPVELVGVGGEGLEAEGLQSLFDYSELSIMGIAQVLARLPLLIRRIGQTANAIIAAKPDALLIIDSPDFTHRVARRVRKALPGLPIVNYVCPSVWAWKEKRAPAMRAYVDHVLAVLPFEPEVMKRLEGPPTTYVGHRLASDRDVLAVRAVQLAKREQGRKSATCLLLPGSRASEITRLLPDFAGTMEVLRQRNPDMRFLLPTVPRQEALVRRLVAEMPIKPEISVGPAEKWKAFSQADAALAASGTVILELGLCGIPVVSAYHADWIIRLMHKRIRIWTAALPNLIADYVIVPEYLNEAIRSGALARWVERLVAPTPERRAMMDGYETVWQRMQTKRPPGESSAAILLSTIAEKKKPGHS